MVTDAALSNRIVQTRGSVPSLHTGVFAKAADHVNQLFCGLSGHDELMRHVENGRMSLQCMSCGHETPGWDLTAGSHRRAA